MSEFDVVVIGAGAAGLSLTRRLAYDGVRRGQVPSVALVEPPSSAARAAARARTWCFWEPERGRYDRAVSASWSRLAVRGADGRTIDGTPGDLRYKMIRSADFESVVGAELREVPQVQRVEGRVTDVSDAPDGARVTLRDERGGERSLRGRWVFDSRPPLRLPPARTTLLQHFRGWFVRTGTDVFDPGLAELMDFRTPQPAAGLSFGYLLPLGPREALVEYTEFSPSVLPTPAYEAALRHYTREVRRLGPLTVLAAEQGVIPMTDGVFPRRAGRSVFRIGTAGGATRPSTGYTFAAIQRQCDGIVTAYRAGRCPVPPPPYRPRQLAMDAVMLRALAGGRVDGAAFLEGLFRRNPLERVLRFLDGRSHRWEELAIGLSTPVVPMLRSAVELPFLPRRSPSHESGHHRASAA